MGTFSKAQEYKLQLNTISIIPIMIHELFLNGLNEGDKIIAEGLTKVRPGMKVKPIIKSQ